MHYVYMLVSVENPSRRYIGVTADLRVRLTEHNSGKSPHTAKFRPWKVATYIAFSDRAQAEAFETYLKSGSGHAFAAGGSGLIDRAVLVAIPSTARVNQVFNG